MEAQFKTKEKAVEESLIHSHARLQYFRRQRGWQKC